jgi:hypothetical protein
MREIERKTQWCPHRRHPLLIAVSGPDVVVAVNASGPATTPVLLGTCVGQICSQWRWQGPASDSLPGPPVTAATVWQQLADRRVRIEPPRPGGLDVTYVWQPLLDAWVRPWAPGLRHGHCGLSGPPGPD